MLPLITRESADELGLEVDREVTTLVKATGVRSPPRKVV
jgi:molybdopterin-binding protein